MRGLRMLAVSLVTLAAIGSAQAHVTLEQEEATPDSSYKAVLRVPHGCEGAATNAVRVQIPEGLIMAKPMPKADWQIELKEGAFAKTYDYYGTPVTKGVQEIAWTGGNLPDNFYDEFVFRVRVTGFMPGTKIHLPVVQECGSAVERWIEIPEAGKSEDDYEYPAPGFTIIAPKAE